MHDKTTISCLIQIFNRDKGIINDLNVYSQVVKYKNLKWKFYLRITKQFPTGHGGGRGGKIDGRQHWLEIGQMRSSRLSKKK